MGMFVAGEMFTVASGKVCIGFNTFCSDLEISWFSPPLKSRVGLGPRILSLRVYDRESFTSFHVQAVVPVIFGETNRHFATRIREHRGNNDNNGFIGFIANASPGLSVHFSSIDKLSLVSYIIYSQSFDQQETRTEEELALTYHPHNRGRIILSKRAFNTA